MNTRTWQTPKRTDGQTDGQTDWTNRHRTSPANAMTSHYAKLSIERYSQPIVLLWFSQLMLPGLQLIIIYFLQPYRVF